MWLSKLVIHNLYSYGEGVACLFENQEEPSTHVQDKVIIFGRNNDEPGMDSNGSGKSSLLNIIFWVLFGEILQNERVDEIVRRGTKKGWAELTLRDAQNILIIKRSKAAKDALDVTFNGESKTTGMTATAAQKEVLKLLGMDLQAKVGEHVTDFLNTTYFSTATVKSIMSKETKSKERFDIIARFLKLKDYDLATEMAKARKKDLLDSLSTTLDAMTAKEQFLAQHSVKSYQDRITTIETSELPQLNGEIKGLDNQIAVEEDRLQIMEAVPNLKNKIESTKFNASTQLNSLQSSFQANEKQIPELTAKISEYEALKAVIDAEAPNISGYNAKITETNNYVSQLNSRNLELINTRGGIVAQKSGITAQIQKHLTCPKCQEALMYDGKSLHPINKAALEQQLATLTESETAIGTKISDNGAAITSYNETITALRNNINQHTANEFALSKLDTPGVIQNKIADLNSRNQQLIKDAEALNTATKQTIDDLNKDLGIAQNRLDSLPPSRANIHDIRRNRDSKQFKVNDCTKEIGRLQQLISQVNQVEQEIKDLQKVIGDKKQEAEIYSFWESGFREIKIKIIEEFLPALEDRVNDYLETLKVNMRVDFDTKRAKASAAKKDLDVGMGYKEEFNISVLKNDTVSPFNMLSQGERGRVATCAGMALRELTRENGSNIFDFLLIDEIADALDKTGLQELIKLLDEIHGQKLVISHSDTLKEQFDQAILVEITDGVSNITNQAF